MMILDGVILMLCLLDPALVRRLGTVILRNLGQYFGWSYSSHFFLSLKDSGGRAAHDCLDIEVLTQKAAELPSVLIQSYVLTPLGISSSHWAAFFHGDMEEWRMLHLFSQSGVTEQKRNKLQKVRKREKKHKGTFVHCSQMWGLSSGMESLDCLLPEERMYFYPTLLH